MAMASENPAGVKMFLLKKRMLTSMMIEVATVPVTGNYVITVPKF